MKVLCFDIGGTWLKAALVDTGQGSVKGYIQIPSRSYQGPQAVIDDMTRLYARYRSDMTGVARVGVAIGGGPVDSGTGHILGFTAGIPGWESYPLAAELTTLVGLPVHVENDANAAALAEWRFGGYGAPKVLVYVTWSTGISSGIVIDGRLFRGAFGIAGEIGHVPLATDGVECICGGTDCLEARVGGRYLSRSQRDGSSTTEIAPDPLSSSFALWVRAFRTIAHLLGPDVVVMGGGVAWAYGEWLGDAWAQARRAFLPPVRERSRFAISSLGKSNTLLGAAIAAEEADTC